MIAADYSPACHAAIRRRDRLCRWHQARARWLVRLNRASQPLIRAAHVAGALLAASAWFAFLASLWFLGPA